MELDLGSNSSARIKDLQEEISKGPKSQLSVISFLLLILKGSLQGNIRAC